MFGIDIGFVHPWYLALLLLLPALWVFSFRSLSGLGRYRRLFALAFRTLVFVQRTTFPGTDRPEFALDNLNAARGRIPDARMREQIISYWDQLG